MNFLTIFVLQFLFLITAFYTQINNHLINKKERIQSKRIIKV